MSSKTIVYSELRASKAYYILLSICFAIAGLGAISFFHLEHEGHYVTGMNNQIVWGLPHVFAIFLIVAASGALNIASIGTVFSKTIYQPLGRLSALLAISLLIGGLAILVLDLGHADRLIIAMTYYNFKSIFAWNIILYNGFLALCILYIWTMQDRKLKAFYPYAGFFAFSWRLILTLGTGSIFGFLVSRAYYNSAVLAPLFIALSFALGLAVFIILLFFTYRLDKRELGDVVLNRLRYLLAIFVAAAMFLELARHLTALYIAQRQGVEQFILLDGGIYTLLFWVGQVLVGGLIPLSLIFCRALKNNHWSLLLASILVIIGGFVQLYVLIVGGQVYPLELFPNAEVQSSFFDGEIHAYAPSIWEWMLGLGGVGLALALFLCGMVALRFLPKSLADSELVAH
ncbi:NrfD/PsrC family molybdoenzyme membrane anchor subunit [uncultured Thiothrix sp.]|uniref:NrfD/PsrC family molybdoenzyme membrane anchor subunit n=1 Tax=uncultured Thiothrix sp. TaxID=223185 RepID=UPI002622C77C|nr:NrfD/PsrC family molybdoenzyme membrane anchor subunit [uncultured Thiothrix sp.]